MAERKDFEKDLEGKLRKQRIRKYSLMVLAVFVVIVTAVSLRIEDKNALLPDGQGNIPVGQVEEKAEQQAQQTFGADDKDKEKDSTPKSDKTSDSEQTGNKDAGDKVDDGKTDAPKNKPTKEEAKNMTAKELSVDNSKDATASNSGNEAYKPDAPEPVTVTITIVCDTLSKDMSQLTNPAIEEYIPEDGVILKTITYEGTTENTVFDALNTVCRNNDIQLEFSYTPLYQSYYIEGINYLYEFDAGNGSGWMFKVNDWFPNYGCSSYYLRDGDEIIWIYTCNMGKDVGGTWQGK
ncbi:MAG: DUF4430 domain-containing protein [Firmicutes bacterium]|nr:DUF4430 domain-containing protein [Bacillota bacterium]